MIKNKQDLIDYLEADRLALGRKQGKPKSTDLIWKYEILLRKCEYWHNCHLNLFGAAPRRWYLKRLFNLGVRCGFSIPLNACGKGLSLAHVGPVVINGGARIGEYCRIHICVNIGTEAGKSAVAPIIGNRVYIAPGSKLFGNIYIADDIAIGANSVVNRSFEDAGIGIAGVPAKKINDKGSKGLLYIPNKT